MKTDADWVRLKNEIYSLMEQINQKCITADEKEPEDMWDCKKPDMALIDRIEALELDT